MKEKNLELRFLLMLIFMLSISMVVYAEGNIVEINGVYYSVQAWSDEPYAVVIPNPNYSDEKISGDVVIQESVPYEGAYYSVTGIESYAFSGCENITSVIIPNSVTNIGLYAFSGCCNLPSVTFPESLSTISDGAFEGCSSLTSVTIPQSVTVIGASAFSGCSSLTSITIQSVTDIGASAFSDCSSLTSLTLAGSSMVLRNAAFSNCSSLASVTIQGEVWGENEVFSGCLKLKEVIFDCETVTSLFSGFTSLDKIVLTEKVKSIGNGAFQNCGGLSTITLSNSIISIGEYAFSGFESLTSIVIPNSVTSISFAAFQSCTNLESITISNNLTRICDNTFGGCTSLSSIIIPESVIQIDYMAFYGCSGLTSITIPNSVTSLGDYCFLGCSSLTSISIPNSVISLGGHCFQGCSSLTSVSISENVSSIGEFCFNDCSSLTSVVIPKGVTYLGESCFYGCNSLASVMIPEGVTSIGESCFSGCGNLISMDIPESVSHIGKYAFHACEKLVSVTLPYITTIEDYLFWGCSNLASITIPVTVMSIGSSSFQDCISLTSITIPSAVSSIGSRAFYGCKNLVSVTSEILVPVDIDPDCFGDYIFSTTINATLYVPLSSIDLYSEKYPWNWFEYIMPIITTKSFQLMVSDDQKQIIEKGYSIIWFDENLNQIGTGSTLGGRDNGSKVYYSVLLDERLGRVFREVIQRETVIEDGVVTCQLEKIGKVKIEGRISAVNIDENPANILIAQKLNGKYDESLSTQTGEKGSFSIEVYDDETEVTVSRPDCINTTIHRNRFGDSGNLGTIPMSLLSGIAVNVNLTYIPAAKIGESKESTPVNGGLGDFEFMISNNSTGVEISDYVVQSGSIIIKSGVSVGNLIKINVTNKKKLYADSNTSFTVEEGSNNISIELTELGGMSVSCGNSNNITNVGYVYDSNNVLVTRGNYIGDELIISHLPNGLYTLVSMRKCQLIGNLSNLSAFNDIGLTQGVDYVSSQVNIENGVIATVSIDDIPMLNETPFYRTTSNAYFTVNKSQVRVGDYITLSSHIELKEKYAKEISELSLIVDLPEGCKMVDNSVILDRTPSKYTLLDNRIIIPLSKDNYQSKIRFCVIPFEVGDYTATAYVSFVSNDHIQQPLGTTLFTAKGLSLLAPSKTSSTYINISGIAPENSEVRIYDNDVLIGNTYTMSDGTWKTMCELDRPYTESFHSIYAKVNTNKGELLSETKQIEYGKNMIMPQRVSMLYYNPEFDADYDIVFDYVNGTTTPSSYYYFPYKNWPNWYETQETEPKAFTFVADFTRNDTTKVKNVRFKVLASDGTIRTLSSIFDTKKNAWVATTKYTSNKLPNNVAIDYDLIPEDTPFDHTRILDDNNQFLNLIKNYATNIDTTKFELMSADDAWIICKYQTLTMDKPIYIRIEQLNYDEWINKIGSTDFLTVEKDGKTTFMKDSLFNDRNYSWIWTKDDKTMLQIEICQKNEFFGTALLMDARTRAVPRTAVGQGLMWFNTWFGISNILNEYEQGLADLRYWLDLYGKTATQHINLYKSTKQLLEAKCPDGSSKLSNTAYDWYDMYLKGYYESANIMRQSFKMRLDWLERDLIARRNNSTVINTALSSLFLLIPETGFGSMAAQRFGNSIINKFGGTIRNWLLDNLGEAVDAAIETRYSNILRTILMNNNWYTAEQLSNWYNHENNEIVREYNDLQSLIIKAYKKCEKEKDDEDDDDEDDDNDKQESDLYEEEFNDDSNEDRPDFSNPSAKEQLDPSGYVYEAVTSNRLGGVTATVYYKDTQEDMYGDKTDVAIKWDAENYSQQNPLITDAAGFYRWDVPQGMWQVKYEKEGYETTYSDWLPVPPPQLDVNIGMRQATAPSVSKMKGYESGIVIDMSKYMRPATFGEGSVTVTRNGVAEKGSVIMLNVEKDPTGDVEFASKMKFVPENQFKTSDEVVVTVHQAVESYCNVPMDADHVETVKIESEIKEIVADDEMSVAYQGSKSLTVLVLPIEASAGRKLNIKTSSSMIVSIDQNQVTIDNEGKASFTINGELLGGAYLTYEVDDTDVAETSKIKVVERDDLVATPEASIKSGNAVVKGTLLSLTCETEGATIYYTLDGSCPCDVDKRIKYTEPFALYPDVTVKAIAVKSGWDDSEIATFVYCSQAENITISSAKQLTYMSDKNLDFTAFPNLKAYVATGYDKASGTIWLTRVKEVPANTGILLMGEAATYEVPAKTGDATSYYQNLFKGTIEGTTIYTTEGSNTNYYLSNGDAGVGFYKVTKEEGVTLGKNRAYLPIPTEIPAIGSEGGTETINVSAAGQVPYCNSQSLDFSSLDAQGVKAYTATGYDYSTGTIWLTRVKQVPAQTGILIMAPQGSYPVPTASVASVYGDMFRGTLSGTTIFTYENIDGMDYINYYLSNGVAGVGFYRVTKEDGVSIGANRCYLPILNRESAGTRSESSEKSQITFEESDEVIGIQLLRGIGGDDDGTTSIKDLTPALSEGEGEWYTLQGQRVAKPGKGVYIRNGKKVVIR